MSRSINSFEQAKRMYEIMKRKGEVTLEDIITQFEVSPSTAYNIQRALRALCEKHEDECEIIVRDRKTIFRYKGKQNEINDEEAKEIEKILNAKPSDQ